jgi:hypothetical protein
MSTNSGTSRGGVGFVGLLTIAFVTLKITGVIAWSWAWVLSPIWITAVVTIIAMLVIEAMRL